MLDGFLFDPVTHSYWLNGRRIPGITELLSIFGYIDKAQYEKRGPNAALRGKAIHSACELLDQNDLDWTSITDDGIPYVMGYEKFLKENDIVIEHEWSEKPLYHPILLFGGTPDRRLILNGRRSIVDLKTGVIQPWAALQTAAQEILMQDEEPFDRYALRLTPDGDYKLKAFTNPRDLPLFKSLVAHYWNQVQYGIRKENENGNNAQPEQSREEGSLSY